ncbi:MAG: autotransporter domain-containing protein [Pseudomonadota bacterium]
MIKRFRTRSFAALGLVGLLLSALPAAAQRYGDEERRFDLNAGGFGSKGTAVITLAATASPNFISNLDNVQVTYDLVIDVPIGTPPIAGFVLDGQLVPEIDLGPQRKGAILVDFFPGSQTPTGTLDGSPIGAWDCNGSFDQFNCTPPGGTLQVGVNRLAVTADIGSKGPTGTVDMTISTATVSALPATAQVVIAGGGGAVLDMTAAMDPVNPPPVDPVDVEVTIVNTSAGSFANPFTVRFSSPTTNFTIPTSFSDANFVCSTGPAAALDCVYNQSNLAPGSQVTLRLPSTSPMFGQVFSVNVDLLPDPGDSAITTSLTPSGDTSTTLDPNVFTNTPEPVPYGQPIVFVGEASNNGPAPARNVSLALTGVDDQFSFTEAFISGTGTNWTCVDGNQLRKQQRVKGNISTNVICDYGPDLAPGQITPPVTITIQAPDASGVSSYSVTPDAFADNGFAGSSPTPVVVAVAPTADLSLAKSADVTSTLVGNQFTYTLDVTNNGPQDVEFGNITVTDTLPPEVSFVSSGASAFSCADSGGTVTCLYSGSPIFLAAGQTESIDFTVSADSSGTAVNSATVALGGGFIDTNSGNDTDSASVSIGGSVDLSLAKSADVSTIGIGGSFNFTLDVTNNGPSDATGFTVTDSMPAEVSYDGFTGADFNCTESAGVVTCNYIGSGLTAGTSTSVDLTVTAQSAGTANNSGSVTVLAPDTDPFTSDNDANASVVITVPNADLSMAKVASAPTVNVGESITYSLTVSNAGPDTAPAFTVTDVLPSEVAYESFTGTDFSCSEASGTVTCDYVGAGLAAAAATTVDLVVSAQTDGATTNSASVAIAAPATDTNPVNDSDTADVQINPGADMTLSKAASASSVQVGDTFDWTITVTNNGPATADGFTVTDTLPPETTLLTTTAPDFNCSTAGADVNCTWAAAPLASAGSSTITLSVSADQPGTVSNSASVSAASNAPDGVPGNNTDSASVVVNALPMTTLVTTVTDDPDPVETEGAFSVVAAISNQGPAPATGLFAVFNLADGVGYVDSSFQKGPSAGWTCTLVTGSSTKAETNARGRKGATSLGDFVDCFNPGPVLVNTTTTLTINLTAPTDPGPIDTGIEIGSVEFGPDFITETTTVGSDVDLSVEKLASQSDVEVGEDFNYTISVTNTLGRADGIVISDTIPPSLQVRGISGRDWTCRQFQNTFQCNYEAGPLDAGNTTSVLTFGVTPTAAGVLANTARVSSDQNDVNPGNNEATATVNVGGVNTVDLFLTKASRPERVVVNQAFQYELTVSNRGESQATNVTLSDQLPAGVEFLAAAAPGWNCSESGGLVQCALIGALLPDVPPSTILFDVVAPGRPGQLINNADVSSSEQEQNGEDNRASAITTVLEEGPDVAVVKTVDQVSARRGDELTYTIDVTNLGTEAATGVAIEDGLPTGLDVTNIVAPNWDCQVLTLLIACDLMGDLGAGASASLSLSGRVTVTSGVLTNRVVVTTTSGDPLASNNGSAVDTTIAGDALPVNLTLSVDDSADPVLSGEDFDYLITFGNEGPGGAQDYAITADIPPTVTPGAIVAPGGVSCGVEGPRLVCRSEGVLPPDDERIIRFTVTAPEESGELTFPAQIQFTGLGVDQDGSDNNDTETTTVRLTPTQQELEQQLTEALGGLNDPLVTNNLEPVADLCANPPPGVLELCRAIVDALDDGRNDEIAEAIRQIVGAPAVTQHTSLVEASSVQFNNMTARFNQNRQGQGSANGGTVNVDGLAFRYGNEILPLSLMQGAESDEPTVDPNGLVKPWAFFVNGTISGGDKDPTQREVGFDFDTLGITMGVDYRFSSRFIGGAALGYTDFDSDIQGGGSLETDGLMLHLFANYYPTNQFYIDGLLSIGSMDFEQRRPIAFTIGDLVVDEQALGTTESDVISGALAFGYNYNRGTWNITPSGSISYLDADIDAFDEAGTTLSLNYNEQNVESLIFSANLSVSKIISLSKGILTPTFDLAYYHESSNDDNDLSTRILGGPASASFLVEADSPDQNYGSAGLGLVFVGANGRQAFLNYRNILGLSGFSRWTVNAGVRIEF